MTRRKGPRARCPRPDKIRFADGWSANKFIHSLRKFDPENPDLPGLVAYWCEAGHWHAGHKQKTGRIIHLIRSLPPDQRSA